MLHFAFISYRDTFSTANRMLSLPEIVSSYGKIPTV